MQNAIKISVSNPQIITRMFKDIGAELNDLAMRGILAKQGMEIVKAARRNTKFPGKIGQQFKRDLAVRRNKITKGKPSVDAGVKFQKVLDDKPSNSRSGNKIAIIAAHMTEGFNQHVRVTNKRGSKGTVGHQYQNPVTAGFRQAQGAIQQATNKEVKRLLAKVKAKNRNVLI